MNWIKKKLNSNQKKRLVENFLSLSALQIVSVLLPLLTLPYIIRVVGFSKYGIIVIATSLIAYFISVTDFSFKITATRDVSTNRENFLQLSLIYSKVTSIKLLLTLFSCLIVIPVIFLNKAFYEERIVFLLTLISLPGYAMFPEWFFQGIEKMKYITIVNVSIKILFTISVFIFIRRQNDYWIYPLLNSLGYITAGLITQFILIKKFKLQYKWPGYNVIVNTIRLNFPIFVNQFLPTLYNNTSTFLLGVLTGTHFSGVYDAIKKIIDIMIIFLDILSRVFFPFINVKREVFGKYNKLMLAVSIVGVVLMLLLHKVIFYYLHISDPNAFVILLILAMGIIGYALYDIYGLNYFIVRKQDTLVMKNTLLASSIGLVMAFPLIYFLGIVGAALNLSVCRWLMGFNLYIKFSKNATKA